MQGLEPGDFMEATGLSQERQKRLLALVLQQQDRLLVEPPVEEAPRSARGASVLHRQIRERTDRSVERAWQTMQHRQTVGQRYTSELDARRVRQVERAQAQENKAERVRVRDQELTAQRRERETIRNNKWQDAINLAAELDVVRKQNLEAHHAANDARSRSAIANRDQERSMKCQQLRHQFQKVMDTAEWKKNDESRQACEKAEWLQQMMKKSDAHQEACRVAYEQRQDERRQTTREREHEVLRVMRMNNYIRQQRANEQQEESVMFEEYLRMRDALPQQVADKLDEKRASVTASLH